MNAMEIHAMWSVWDAHGQAIVPYKVCREGCHESWPCASRRDADSQLREAGVDPYAVKRGEVAIPAL
ncbi:hypothetical protein Afil01_64250 [Actinorhabdospora filicis]|uniref:Uncharacterized protein n=1 Tax=Actinorhabdospora filicis TaxID=1785913 RepID=A0A9W6SSN0_9ACTN|nr:hypothetical protein [Actinorhabdospora filicis]GLZ81618.1 hypothetical protein Afil01_64250 [Actinorhabdospora filicis]